MEEVVADCSLAEMMCIVAARYMKGSGTTFVGLGLPMLSALLAKMLHDPEIAYCTEVGVVDWQPEFGGSPRAPRGVGDPILTVGTAYLGDMLDTLGTLLMGSSVDTAVLSGGQIDRYGNLNTLLIGSYSDFARRFPGSGGNTDLACMAKRTIVIMPFEPRRFVKRVDFLSSPGYIDGPGARRRAGLEPQGPNLVITTLGVFGFDTSDGGETGSCEMELRALMPGVEAEGVAALIPWPLRLSPTLNQISPPTQEEITLLRRLDQAKTYLRDGRY